MINQILDTTEENFCLGDDGESSLISNLIFNKQFMDEFDCKSTDIIKASFPLLQNVSYKHSITFLILSRARTMLSSSDTIWSYKQNDSITSRFDLSLASRFVKIEITRDEFKVDIVVSQRYYDDITIISFLI